MSKEPLALPLTPRWRGAGEDVPARGAVLQPRGRALPSQGPPVPGPGQLHHHGLVPHLDLRGMPYLPDPTWPERARQLPLAGVGAAQKLRAPSLV